MGKQSHPAQPLRHHSCLLRLFALALLFIAARPADPYSVQTHQQLIDLAWAPSIRPLLLKRYPNLTEKQLQVAHAYAYGGCAIQDFGYYPFANGFFSQLTHYVRSGDFVLALIRNAQNADELAFAIGSLSHYIGDTIGHGSAINRSVPLVFPQLRTRYGAVVNYAEDPHAHVRTEFAFDIDQLSKRRFPPPAYTRHVGLEVPNHLLRQSFFEIYGIPLPNLIGRHNAAVRTYRFAVRRFLPDIARAETLLHKKSFPDDPPSADLTQFTNSLLQASTENNWEMYRKSPGFTSHLYAGFIYILPKFGALSMLAIKSPTPVTEALYIHSVNRSVNTFHYLLDHFDTINRYTPNRDLDTGYPMKPGTYRLADETYAKLLAEVCEAPTRAIPLQVKHDILDYYANPDAKIVTKKNPQKWAVVENNLKTLANVPTTGDLDPTFAEDPDDPRNSLEARNDAKSSTN